MFRPIVGVLCVALAVASAVDISQVKTIRVDFDGSDGVPRTKLLGTEKAELGPGFIGDIYLGQRYADETIFRRVVEFENPTDVVQGTTLNLSIANGIIHFVSMRNNPGSYAVVCDDATSLGTSKTNIKLRVNPQSSASLILTIAAHSAQQRLYKVMSYQ
ncbi:uncharacterized protein LOC143149382 [Ptiloglossa arizonensis]|uniref:uncharacterized protein LOC143149382 n=1 Tax=Ptiloglossa arizonensis TaxID=3350558 RepID=UPI003FA04F57